MRNVLMGAVAAAALGMAPVAMAQEAETDIQARTPAPEVTIEQDITVQPGVEAEVQDRTVQPQTQTTTQQQPAERATQQVAQADCAEMTIYFDRNADEVLNEKEAEVAEKAEACQAETVRVVGYTDESGDAEYNKMLGERRAEAVKGMLVAMGVPAENIMVESKGEEEATGNADQDRKVEVEFEMASSVETEQNAG